MVGITMRVGSGRRARLLHTLHWTGVGQKPPVDLRGDFPPEGVQPTRRPWNGPRRPASA